MDSDTVWEDLFPNLEGFPMVSFIAQQSEHLPDEERLVTSFHYRNDGGFMDVAWATGSLGWRQN